MDTLKISWKMPGGVLGTDSTGKGPFARALRQLLEEGKPFKSLSQCFFNDGSGVHRWLGVFVHSAGDRVLFFPGVADPVNWIRRAKSGEPVKQEPLDFDHLSLERDRETWHATSARSKEHLAGPPTLSLGDGRAFLFGMSVANSGVLWPVMAETEVSARIHPNDSSRRADVIQRARAGRDFPMLSLNTDHPLPQSPAYLHFAVIVGPTGFPEYRGPEFGMPANGPFVMPVLTENPAQLPVQIARFSLSDKLDIQITSMSLSGALSVPACFSTPLAS